MSKMAAKSMSSPSLRANYDTLLEIGHEVLGFDPMIVVNVSIVLGAVAAFLHYTGQSLYKYAKQFVLSSVHINEDDALYEQVMRYMADYHLASKRFRSAKATTPVKTTWEDEEDAARAQAEEHGTSTFDRNKLVSYRSAINRVPVRLAPFEGDHLLRHASKWILFSHRLHRQSSMDPWNSGRERGYITLRCLGRSLNPIQKLLDDAQKHSLDRSLGTTKILRGMSGLRSDRLMWQPVLSRPARDIRTVILDRQKKSDLLADINEYLHPQSRRWYANRGIPYRRGYLFSGTPGMGKTSLTAALAGVFGLDIYVLSLLDPQLTESHLMRLLGEVPSRCIVLLEDVDAAGLNRPSGDSKVSSTSAGGRGKGSKGAAAPPPDDAAALVASATGADVPSTAAAAPVSTISLSGLLNAIDGVSSHEGHILIMTTNNPEKLDRALVRPGRVDMHIDFELPRRPEIRALFLSMYRDLKLPLGQDHGSKMPNGPSEKVNGIIREHEKAGDADDNGSNTSYFEFEATVEMQALADKFANALPERSLSLATVQGYLLRYKNEPQAACDHAEEWAKHTANDNNDRNESGE